MSGNTYPPSRRKTVSWRLDDGPRIFGWFVRWDANEEYAICRTGAGQRYIHKSQLTFEGQ